MISAKNFNHHFDWVGLEHANGQETPHSSEKNETIKNWVIAIIIDTGETPTIAYGTIEVNWPEWIYAFF